MSGRPHWNSAIDYSKCRFYIRRMDTSKGAGTYEIPVAGLPLFGFIYVVRGEVLVEADGSSFLCQPGHVLVIPVRYPFSIRYCHDAAGYTGAFSATMLADAAPLRFLTHPVHQAFWFDEGVFMGELFNMMMTSYEKNDEIFIEKGLDLFLSRLKAGNAPIVPATVNRFLESIFNPGQPFGTLSSYACAAGISENYLSRQVKRSTGRSVGGWIDIARVQRSKKLLSETSLPIIDVASAVGLDDQSYFSRFFKRQTGQSPRDFRKTMQG